MSEFVEFHEYIWNQKEKCIQISTNRPGIGSYICEIDVDILEIWESKATFVGCIPPLQLAYRLPVKWWLQKVHFLAYTSLVDAALHLKFNIFLIILVEHYMVTLNVPGKWPLKLDTNHDNCNTYTGDTIQWNVAWRCSFKNNKKSYNNNHWHNFCLHFDIVGIYSRKRISPPSFNISEYWLLTSHKTPVFLQNCLQRFGGVVQ